MNEQVRKYVNYIISHQTSDGWFGADCCDPWPRYPLLLGKGRIPFMYVRVVLFMLKECIDVVLYCVVLCCIV